MMKNMFECDLIFCKYRCICVDIGNILVGLLHSSLSHLNQRKTNFVSKSSWIYFSINKFTSVLTFLTVLLIIIYLVCRTLIRCFYGCHAPSDWPHVVGRDVTMSVSLTLRTQVHMFWKREERINKYGLIKR